MTARPETLAKELRQWSEYLAGSPYRAIPHRPIHQVLTEAATVLAAAPAEPPKPVVCASGIEYVTPSDERVMDLAHRAGLRTELCGAASCVWSDGTNCVTLGDLHKLLRLHAESLLPKPVGWISVEERTPPRFEEVLIAFRDTPLPATGQYTASPHDTWGWSFPRENDPEDTGPITHWQPLPAHPAVTIDGPEAARGDGGEG